MPPSQKSAQKGAIVNDCAHNHNCHRASSREHSHTQHEIHSTLHGKHCRVRMSTSQKFQRARRTPFRSHLIDVSIAPNHLIPPHHPMNSPAQKPKIHTNANRKRPTHKQMLSNFLKERHSHIISLHSFANPPHTIT